MGKSEDMALQQREGGLGTRGAIAPTTHGDVLFLPPFLPHPEDQGEALGLGAKLKGCPTLSNYGE